MAAGQDGGGGMLCGTGASVGRDPTGGVDRSRRREVGILLAVVLLLGLPIRLIVADRAVMLSRDAVGFIWYAQQMSDDPLAAIRRHAQHPLYPAMLLGAHELVERLPVLPSSVRSDPVRSWTLAAVGVTMLGGLAVIAACYLLTAALFDRWTGLLAAVLAAVAAEFCQLSADGLTDMPHLAVYITALWTGLRGFQTGRIRWFFWTGLLAGTGYLFRPEGAEPAVVTALILVVPKIWCRPWRHRLIALTCLLAGSAIMASPYMLVTGKLVQKKSIRQFLGSDDDASAAVIPPPTPPTAEPALVTSRPPATCASTGLVRDIPRALVPIAENWARSLRVTLLLPFFLWLSGRRRWPADRMGVRMVQVAASLHVLILLALIIQFSYWDLFSLRHVMVLAGLTLPFAAAGILAFIESLPPRHAGWAAMLLGLGLIAPTLPWMFEARHRDDAHYLAAARWIAENTPRRPRIMTERYRMAFYADGDYIPAPYAAGPAAYLAAARQSNPDWLVFDERRILRESPGFFDGLHAGLAASEELRLARTETIRLERGSRRVLVYRYRKH